MQPVVQNTGGETRRPLQVGWLVWGDESGGVATAVLNNAQVLKQLGQEVVLWCLGPGMLADAATQRGWQVHGLGQSAELHQAYIRYGFSVMGGLRRIRVLLGLRKTLQNGLGKAPPDVLCLPWPDLMPLAGPVARHLGIGLVLEMPNTPSHYPFQLNQRLYAWATRRWRVQIFANSEFSASRLALVPKVAVVTPAVDAERFDPAQVVPVPRKLLGLPENAIVLGLIARLDPSKGADLLLSALAALRNEVDDLHLLLVGGPLASDYGLALRTQVKTAGLEQRVHWVDTVPDPERYWGACDLAINARHDVEPFGLSIIEAMLMARPVLAHSLGQPGTTIEDGRTGWLYHRPDVAALVEALRRALDARKQWPAMGHLARAEALRRFASDAASRHYLHLLQAQTDQARKLAA